MSWTRLAIVGLLLGGLAACPAPEPGPVPLGGAIDEAALRAKVTSLSALPQASEGADIVVEGTVGKVCPAGCWFYLHSPDDLVYVDVLGDFTVPQEAEGRGALVKARVAGEGGARILQAQRVLLAPPVVK